MCGIAGFADFSFRTDKDDLRQIVSRMTETLHHRGPDDKGVWVDEGRGIALGHRRLSIIDLSPMGRQPMVSSCGRYVIVLNGEIYNFQELQRDLQKQGCSFRGHSDTEVALCAISSWGFEEALKKFNGMFALAIWDKEEHVLRLARDRMGEKPLYYGFIQGVFVFASECKAIRSFPLFSARIDRNSLALFLRHSYIPAPYTIYEGLYKLPAGNILSIDAECRGVLPSPAPYWNAKLVVEQGLADSRFQDEGVLLEETEKLLKNAVKIRMYSDVPLGVFLSGGIDSTLVTALMQSQSNRPIRSFTIGFKEKEFNEAKYASQIAAHLGIEHTELQVRAKDALDVIPKLPDIYDEPFADSSSIPTYLLSKLTRDYVTVALSGDGGDELFGGYNRYLWSKNIWQSIRRVPRGMRRNLQAMLQWIPADLWDRAGKLKIQSLADKMQKISEILPLENQHDVYYSLISQWKDPSAIVIDSSEPLTRVTDPSFCIHDCNSIEWMMFIDMCSYLPDDILVKVDRASMASGLEARAVYLDHRIVESAWKMPFSLKMRGRTSKWILRQILDRYVPARLVERPKMGFGVPLSQWLRGPLKDWAEGLLDEQKLKREGYFMPEEIRAKWQEHLRRKRNWHHYLWNILMFQAWEERWT